MQEVVNEEFFEELAADYEFKSKSIKKWWNMLTSSFDFIQKVVFHKELTYFLHFLPKTLIVQNVY